VVERLAISVGAACCGWGLGWLSAAVTEWLAAEHVQPRRLLVRDWLTQACCAAAWALAAWLFAEPWWRWLAAGVLAVPLIQVAVTDLRHRYVYSLIALAGAVLGVALGWLVHGGEWWYGLAGAAAGFAAFAVIYLLGRLLYRGREALAWGDVTIAAMVGAGAGVCALNALVIGVVIGGAFALGLLLARRSRHGFLPYGPGLCLGGLVTLLSPTAC
jgi:leader peptidase (prepilin peptidase)/N-methyltransferase